MSSIESIEEHCQYYTTPSHDYIVSLLSSNLSWEKLHELRQADQFSQALGTKSINCVKQLRLVRRLQSLNGIVDDRYCDDFVVETEEVAVQKKGGYIGRFGLESERAC
jgi:hypothetical protein